ncbi:MAG TPA: Gfo/Idh/MocA family oxidoreductase [bacterium]|nr:Gfo/Idh/MocA family oxidoreductase [bacterium]HOL48946.1 Gfo/Idh/MocA family oxidoreductase [bacterium]HPO51219.1 Gfo/Idh/MocA family oxidoreductase [bacterium]HXK45227.1 Gfo/Idh/MocA family oxidoreductase [bacterium]
MGKKQINVGLIGYKFMGKAHSHAYRDISLFFDTSVVPVMKMICGRHDVPLSIAQEKFGWQERTTDWKKITSSPEIDLVDITTPPDEHKDIAIEAAKEGKVVFCEKPLANSLKEGYEMLEAVEKYKVKHAICFNYRKLPAVGLAKKLIEEGKLGKIYHVRAVYLQDWILDPEFPLVWRLQKNIAGSGAHGDLNAHLIDMTRYLVGEFSEVVGVSETFIKERPLLIEKDDLNTGLVVTEKSDKKGKVDVDDATLFLARFENGAIGSFEATRFAPGRKNGQKWEINGSKGSIVFNLERLNELEYYSVDDPACVQGFRTILATDASHPYAANWWPAGHIIGYGDSFVNMVADVLNCVATNKMPSPNFADGVKCQEVLEAVEESIMQGKWVKIKSKV